MKNKTLIKIGFVIASISTYFFIEPFRLLVNQAIFILQNVDVQLAKDYILSFGLWAPVISFFLMILQSLIAPLPAFIITFANAGLFGWVNGAILSWSSAMVGAMVCFWISRFYGRDTVEKITSKGALKSVDDFFDKYGNYAVLVARLLPFVSFDIVSYAAGLTKLSFWSFVIATGIGQLPATLVYSYIGGMLTGATKAFVMGLLILFALTAIIALAKKIYDDKNKLPKEGKNEKIS